MLAIGLVLNTLGIGLFCWAIIALAVYALPFFVALIIGMMTFHSDAGLIGAMLIATAGGALTLVLGQVAFAVTRSSALRIAIATAFAVPAAVAGYHVVFAVSNIGVPSLAWREVFACARAGIVAPAVRSAVGKSRLANRQRCRPVRRDGAGAAL